MTRPKTRIAAAATVVALGGVAGIALGQGHQRAAPGTSVADQPVVRTKVIEQTIHVTRHAGPTHPSPITTATSGSGGGESDSGDGSGHDD